MILMRINHNLFHLRLWATCTKDLFSANQDVQLVVLYKSRCAIIARFRLTTGTAFLKDDVWLNIHPGAGSYTVDIHFGAWSYTVVIHNWISNGYPSWSWMKAVSTIPLQLTPWSGYLVVKWWGAENHRRSWIIDLNNSPLPHPNKSFSVAYMIIDPTKVGSLKLWICSSPLQTKSH